MTDSSETSRLARPSAPAEHAMRLLRIDPRTARKRIRNYVEGRPGPRLQGFIEPGEDRDRYRFYTDAINGQTNSSGESFGNEVHRLEAALATALAVNSQLESRVTEAEARYAATAATCRQLLAAQKPLLDAAKCFMDAGKCLADGAAAYAEALTIYGDLIRRLSLGE